MRKSIFIAAACLVAAFYSCSGTDFTVEVPLLVLIGEDEQERIEDLEGKSAYLGVLDNSGATAPQVIDSTVIKDGKIIFKNNLPKDESTEVYWVMLESNSPFAESKYNPLLYFVPEKGKIVLDTIPGTDIWAFMGTPKNDEIAQQTQIFVQLVEADSYRADLYQLDIKKMMLMDSLHKDMGKTKGDPDKYDEILKQLSAPIDAEMWVLANDMHERQFLFLEQHINTIFGRQTFYGLLPDFSAEQTEQILAGADDKITGQKWIQDVLLHKIGHEASARQAFDGQ